MNQQERILKLAQEKIAVVGLSSARFGKTYKAAFELAVMFTLANLWISVKENKPELLHEGNNTKWSDRVLIRLDNGDIIESYYWEGLKEDRGFVPSGWGYIDIFNTPHVAHWMPVPKLLKGGEK